MCEDADWDHGGLLADRDWSDDSVSAADEDEEAADDATDTRLEASVGDAAWKRGDLPCDGGGSVNVSMLDAETAAAADDDDGPPPPCRAGANGDFTALACAASSACCNRACSRLRSSALFLTAFFHVSTALYVSVTTMSATMNHCGHILLMRTPKQVPSSDMGSMSTITSQAKTDRYPGGGDWPLRTF